MSIHYLKIISKRVKLTAVLKGCDDQLFSYATNRAGLLIKELFYYVKSVKIKYVVVG